MTTTTPNEWLNTDPAHPVNRIIAEACHLAGHRLFQHLSLPVEAFSYERSIEELESLCNALLQEATDLMLLRRALEDAVLDEYDALYAAGLVDALRILERSADEICVRLMVRIEFDQSFYAMVDDEWERMAA